MGPLVQMIRECQSFTIWQQEEGKILSKRIYEFRCDNEEPPRRSVGE